MSAWSLTRWSRVRWSVSAAAVALAALLATHPAEAVQPDEILADRALETRARALSAEIRCLVCQNQSIDDSDAPLARDLRLLVRERLRAGDDEGGVRAFIVARYGDFVLLKPPVNGATLLLWFGPALVLAGAGTAVVLRRRAAASPAPAPLSAEEEAALASLSEGDREGALPRSA